MEAIAKCEAVTAEDTKRTTAEGEDKVEDFDGKEHGENCPDDEQVETEEPPEEGTLEQGRAPAEAKDPYGYLNREEFTSEIFKIEISNLPRFGFKVIKLSYLYLVLSNF